jgi:hypothetical protein
LGCIKCVSPYYSWMLFCCKIQKVQQKSCINAVNIVNNIKFFNILGLGDPGEGGGSRGLNLLFRKLKQKDQDKRGH